MPDESKPVSRGTRTISPPGNVALRRLLFSGLAVGGLSLDLATKHYVFAWRDWPGEQETWWLIGNTLGIQTSINHGALFGLGSGFTLLFVTLSFGALAAIGYFAFFRREPLDRWLMVALGLVTGGIIGNLYDRMGLFHTATTPAAWKYGVRDWILFRIEGIPLFDPWPNFNVADCCLVIGACLLAIHSLRAEPKSKG